MQQITPCLWFNENAEAAVNYYVSVFARGKIAETARYGAESAAVSGKPEGSVMTIAFEIAGAQFVALNGGPLFSFTPATSFFVLCETEQEIDTLWKALSDGGMAMMPLQQYPFSERYGWVQDKFGLSWQLNLTRAPQRITPALLFVGAQNGKVEAAMQRYTTLMPNSRIIEISRYAAGEGDTEGHVKYARFSLNGHEFVAMESGFSHAFTITQAVSYMLYCDTQQEIDMLWEQLSAGGQQQPCGWLIDTYGVAWQVMPATLDAMITDSDPEKARRVMRAMLKMHKLDMAALQKAYDG